MLQAGAEFADVEEKLSDAAVIEAADGGAIAMSFKFEAKDDAGAPIRQAFALGHVCASSLSAKNNNRRLINPRAVSASMSLMANLVGCGICSPSGLCSRTSRRCFWPRRFLTDATMELREPRRMLPRTRF